MSTMRRTHLARLRRNIDAWQATVPPSTPLRLRAVPSAISRRQPTIGGARSLVLSRPTLAIGKRFASTAAATKEVEEDEEAGATEQQWPQRVLPELTKADVKRLSRQRNIGM
jgi:hypothetical protein